MFLNVLGNVAKNSGECPETSPGILPNIPGNVLKHSGECCQTFWGILPIFVVNEDNYWVEPHLESCQTSTLESSSAKIANGLNTLTISSKKLHRRYSTGYQMRL